MTNSGDYFSPAPTVGQQAATAPPSSFTGADVRRGRHPALVPAIVVIALALGSVLAWTVVAGGDSPDQRAIGVPSAIGHLPLRDLSDEARANLQPLLRRMFGSRASVYEEYVDPPGIKPRGIAFMLAGRGPVDLPDAGDVALTADDRIEFGEVTCAHMQYEGTILTRSVVCWYSTPAFGVSLLAPNAAFGSMAVQAAALEAVIPQLRDGQAG